MNIVRRIEQLEVRARELRLRQAMAPVTLNDPADVLALLTEQANAVRTEPGIDPVERARTLVSIGAVALRAIEGRDLAERLDAVERVLKLRKASESKGAGHGRKSL